MIRNRSQLELKHKNKTENKKELIAQNRFFIHLAKGLFGVTNY